MFVAQPVCRRLFLIFSILLDVGWLVRFRCFVLVFAVHSPSDEICIAFICFLVTEQMSAATSLSDIYRSFNHFSLF